MPETNQTPPEAPVSPPVPPPQGENPPIVTTPPAKTPLPNKWIAVLGVGLFLAAIVPISIYMYASQLKSAEDAKKTTISPAVDVKQLQKPSPTPTPKIPSATVVYGRRNGANLEIKTYDLASKKTADLVSFSPDIKKLNFLSPQLVLYIDQVDNKKNGTQIIIYDIQNKELKGSIKAEQEYRIADYVMSPDKNYLAIWEVSYAYQAETLKGGYSRVYAVNLSRPASKQLLYDEQIRTVPVHYPRAILDSGRVLSDKFLPNNTTGEIRWEYGMSIVDFDGTNKRDLDQMQGGSYGTQPFMSPDGKYLIFAGISREPNILELLDTSTLERKTLENVPTNNIYTSTRWDEFTGKIIAATASDHYQYDLSKKSITKVNLPQSGTDIKLLSLLPGDKILTGIPNDSTSTLGVITEGYTRPLNRISAERVFVDEPFVQYITVLPEDYFRNK